LRKKIQVSTPAIKKHLVLNRALSFGWEKRKNSVEKAEIGRVGGAVEATCRGKKTKGKRPWAPKNESQLPEREDRDLEATARNETRVVKPKKRGFGGGGVGTQC